MGVRFSLGSGVFEGFVTSQGIFFCSSVVILKFVSLLVDSKWLLWLVASEAVS